MEQQWMIYGANGYTGELIARLAKDRGLSPVLAGRTEAKVKPLAEELELPYRIFSLGDAKAIAAQLEGFQLVLHAAGPFMYTARSMMEACVLSQTHYLDITGEIPVFELGAKMGDSAAKAGIMIMPGVGFDVVPTDCMATFLKAQLPDATHLQLAFASKGTRFSRGTALTMTQFLGRSSAVRQDGKITKVPVGHKAMTVPFADDFKRLVMTIPWGDVSTAYYSSGIPNIETYTAVHPKTYRYVKLQKYFGWFLRLSWVQARIQKRILNGPAGPSPEQRKNGRSMVWGQVKNANGDTVTARSVMPEGYTLTAITSIIITERVLNGQAKTGFQTPAKAYGPDLILEVEGAERALID